jgi:hypothetical protein
MQSKKHQFTLGGQGLGTYFLERDMSFHILRSNILLFSIHPHKKYNLMLYVHFVWCNKIIGFTIYMSERILEKQTYTQLFCSLYFSTVRKYTSIFSTTYKRQLQQLLFIQFFVSEGNYKIDSSSFI